LPIELDATCNGFQHLAMFTGFLSKENTNKEELNLFKNLNLTSST
jgi:DNA-directed RNA polymerase